VPLLAFASRSVESIAFAPVAAPDNRSSGLLKHSANSRTLAAGAASLLSTMLFGLAATDLVTFAQVSLIVGAVSLLAFALPTMRRSFWSISMTGD
jgi:hypothetical protein